MKLYIKQRLFSWREKFDITDEFGNPVFIAQTKPFYFAKKLWLYDNSGQEVGRIEQQLWHWFPHYDLYVRDTFMGTIVQKFSFFKHRFYYKGLDWRIEGDFLAHTYAIYNEHNLPVAVISKKWFAWADTYEIDIAEGVDPVFILVSVIIVDSVSHPGR